MPSILNATTTSGLVTSADNSGSLQLATNNGTTALTIDTLQNVGIGTASPNSSNKLQVAGDIALSWATDKFIGMKFDSGTSYKMGLMLKDSSRECKVWSQSVDSDDKITFYTGSTPSERMRITSSGQLAVGATSAGASKVLLTNSNNVSGDQNTSLQLGANCNNTSSYYLICTTVGSGADRMYILGNGNLQNTNNSYGALSDVKLKENIVDATPKLDKLNQVRVVSYNLKENPEQKLLGVIAQELEQVFPSMIEETPDRDAEGNVLDTTTKAVKYSVFVPMLIKAIQELKAELDATKAEVQALKGVA